MTNQEMAYAIAMAFRKLQAKEVAYETLLSRIQLEGQPIAWKQMIQQDVAEDLAPLGQYDQALQSFAHELGSANPSEVLEALYRELFDPAKY
jgi:hypothetical protein